MRTVTIVHTFDVDDDATQEQIETLSWASAVQIDDPADGEGDAADFSTHNLTTSLTVDGITV